jgi:multidrug transporter EmrE-like cation transporter
MQWLSLAGGILILGYGILKLFESQPEWIPMILGVLIIAFSVSMMIKSREEKEESDQSDE